MIKVLVTDGENRSSLAAVRSLGKKGCRVFVTGRRSDNLASRSKYCSGGLAVPDPMEAGASYGAAIRDIVQRGKIDVVFPMAEVSIYLLNQIRMHLPKTVSLACAGAEKMAAVSNKFGLFRMAEKLNVPVPRTHYVAGPEEVAGLLDEIEQYPVVIKPSLSKIFTDNGFFSGGVMYAGSKTELMFLYSKSRILQHPSLVQEKIKGPGTGLFTLYDRDRHLALFSHRRLREKPPSGGVSVVSESVAPDPQMVEYAGRLLAEVKWDGVAMVEFKRDLRDGTPRLMEINGRFWGTLQLAIACGVDFPALLADKIMGKNPGVQPGSYKVGHKLKWILGTLDHLVIRLKNNNQSLNLPPNAPSKPGAIMDFLKTRERNCSFDVFDRNDLRPFLHEIRDYAESIIK